MYIRRAKTEDIQQIVSMYNQVYLYEKEIYSNINIPSKEFLSEIEVDIVENLDNADYIFLVGEYNKEYIGFLAGRIGKKPKLWNNSLFSHIEGLFIYDKYRGSGYAQKLCDHFFAWAKSKGSDRVLLDVLKDNISANKLYQKLGFNIHLITLEKEL